MLDSSTLEHVILALCVTPDWKLSIKCLEDIKITCKPSSSTYTAIISRAFDSSDTIKIGWDLLNEMIAMERKPQCKIFISWINYCKKNQDLNESLKNIEKMIEYIGNNDILVSKLVAESFENYFKSKNIKSKSIKIKSNGKCSSCQLHLLNISITNKEFKELSDKFLQKVLLRDNVFLKSTPEEIEKFENFLLQSQKFDIVIDGLNVAYSTGTRKPLIVFAKLLANVVKYFSERNRNILVLGRKHMNAWPKNEMNYIRKNAKIFLTDNLSQDDPFLLYAAIKSGPTTDFFSRDLMRSHSYLLGNEMKGIFRRWQQEHQFSLIYAADNGKVSVRVRLIFLFC